MVLLYLKKTVSAASHCMFLRILLLAHLTLTSVSFAVAAATAPVVRARRVDVAAVGATHFGATDFGATHFGATALFDLARVALALVVVDGIAIRQDG